MEARVLLPVLALLGAARAAQEPVTSRDQRSPAEWIEALHGEERERAIAALAGLGRSAHEPLVRAFEAADAELAWQIARAFRAMGAQGTLAASRLLHVVRDAKMPAHARLAAAVALGGLGEGAKGSAKGLVEALGQALPPELELHVAIALCEIGPASAAELGHALGDDDLGLRLWAVSGLDVIRTRPPSVNKTLLKLTGSLAIGEDRGDYLLQPSAERILRRDGLETDEPPDIAAYLAADLQMRFGGKKQEILLLRGGSLEDELLADPESLRKLLLDELGLSSAGLSSATEAHALALPERISDWDKDKVITTGELVRALALHLGDVLAERTQALRSGSHTTHAEWSRSSAEAFGLVRVLQGLLEPSFLEKSRYLEIFMERHYGFRVPADASGF